MTRYELVSRGAREVKNELKTGLSGSDESVLPTTPRPVTVFCLEVMSASRMRDLKSEKRFPSQQNCLESVK